MPRRRTETEIQLILIGLDGSARLPGVAAGFAGPAPTQQAGGRTGLSRLEPNPAPRQCRCSSLRIRDTFLRQVAQSSLYDFKLIRSPIFASRRFPLKWRTIVLTTHRNNQSMRTRVRAVPPGAARFLSPRRYARPPFWDGPCRGVGVVSEKSIVLYWAVLKWSVQSDR